MGHHHLHQGACYGIGVCFHIKLPFLQYVPIRRHQHTYYSVGVDISSWRYKLCGPAMFSEAPTSRTSTFPPKADSITKTKGNPINCPMSTALLLQVYRK